MSTIKNQFYETLVTDMSRNKGNYKILMILIFHRIANVASRLRKQSRLSWVVTVPYLVLYRFVTEWLFQLDLPAALTLGKGVIIDHGYALVLNKNVIIGNFCRLRHSTTIGCKLLDGDLQGPSPIIGNYVDIGANCVILGAIKIGDHVTIGAGSVVVKDVPSYSVIVGNPARVIRKNPIDVLK
jgi:putative colanic acid biosynthesis acetyltransferase WcaB